MSRSTADKPASSPRPRRDPRPADRARSPQVGRPAVRHALSTLGLRFEVRAALLVLLLLLASGLTFDPKLYINGDNVDYILLAKRLLASGELWPSRKFPPFFPMLLAPVQALFGTAWIPQKLWVFGFYLASGPLLLKLAERLLRPTAAFVATLLGLTLIPIVEFSHYVMSEIPFLFLTLAAILAGERLIGARHRDWRSSALFALFSGAAFYTRTAGAALLVGAVWIAAILRRARLLAWLLAIAALVAIPWALHTALAPIEGASYLDQVLYVNPYYPEHGTLNGERLVERLEYNGLYYFLEEIPGALVPVHYVSTYTISRSKTPQTLPLPFALAIVAILSVGAVRAARKSPLLVGMVATSLAVALLWPPIWASIRFVLPILPLLIVCLVLGAVTLVDTLLGRLRQPAAQKAFLRTWVLGIAAASSLALSASNLVKYERETDRYPAVWAAYFEAVEWSGRHLPPGRVVLDRKPNIFTLVSDLPSVSFPRETDPDRMLSYLREKNVRYVHAATIPYDDLTRILYPFLQQRSRYFDVIWSSEQPGTGGAILEFYPDGNRAGFDIRW